MENTKDFSAVVTKVNEADSKHTFDLPGQDLRNPVLAMGADITLISIVNDLYHRPSASCSSFSLCSCNLI
ncbi:MAG: hypothetical protein M2R45_03336 [Verrucomicrobia subdivision 3 bacterium]|nr:hypothetical protein [Limisphaerales bacterium]MCS1415382.1 hypothetical protein [Limisphaerales bacterium]